MTAGVRRHPRGRARRTTRLPLPERGSAQFTASTSAPARSPARTAPSISPCIYVARSVPTQWIRRRPSRMTFSKVCEGGAGLHPQGGAGGGAEVAVCEGNSRGSQPKDRASSVSPRYDAKGLGIQGLSPFLRLGSGRGFLVKCPSNARWPRAARGLRGLSETGSAGLTADVSASTCSSKSAGRLQAKRT